ncbi:MAG: 4-phosphoerythronate dehydrogenase PdxB [Gammaproteobacteria bacterium]|nr:MAG: 4-phosphoerythronate dehydrogenase PdxB [Gammaproteobacteria bacterium]
MKIVADENIPLLKDFFASIGEVYAVPGRSLEPNQVKDADILLIRSVTQVDQSLLKDSNVRFVGTATIGLDHIDCDYLDQHGIVYANAPGCNALSVVEYIFSCLTVLAEIDQIRLEEKSVGIVGCGHIGGALAKKLKKLGVEVLINDPPLARMGVRGLVSLDDVLKADIISLHVPLTKTGQFATEHLIDQKVLMQLSENQVLINSSRGRVVDNGALLQKLEKQPGFRVVLDVWENEPAIATRLLEKVIIGTPHIAGYSLDGKAKGTEIVCRELCQYLGLPGPNKAARFLPMPPLTTLGFSSQADTDWAVTTAIRASYDVRIDNWKLKNKMHLAATEFASHFDRVRKDYPVRREFGTIKVMLDNTSPKLADKLKTLGFVLE